jgi:regulator of nucleoside diphosphate kinase
MSQQFTLKVTSQDLERLQALIPLHATAAVEQLDSSLATAEIVPAQHIAQDVVTMNSEVIYEDLTSGAKRRVRIVYPAQADAQRGWVSVLAPLGAALLGTRTGCEVEWPMGRALRHARVLEVPYQPEANGDFDL